VIKLARKAAPRLAGHLSVEPKRLKGDEGRGALWMGCGHFVILLMALAQLGLRQPRLNLRQPLLRLPDLPAQPLPSRPMRRSILHLPPMGRELFGQLGALLLKGLALVQGSWLRSGP